MDNEEDAVSYWIYPTKDCVLNLEDFHQTCSAIICGDVSNYLWHRDRLHLRINHEEACLEGRVQYGENVEDEWFIVSLLLKITKHVPTAVARVTDTDGEIILIESADHIPNWAQEPDIADKRVFLFQGKIHMIPVADRPSNVTPFASHEPIKNVRDAVSCLPFFAKQTIANQAVQEAIERRIDNYPSDWRKNQHYTQALMPLKAGIILKEYPQLVSAAITSFVHMDPIDVRNTRDMKHFQQNDVVRTGVRMTKCLYAMLQSRDMRPPKKSGWKLPEAKDKDFKEYLIGFKLVMGLEVLMARKRKVQKRADQEQCPQALKVYVRKLSDLGYFRGYLQGSAEYKKLLNEAMVFWKRGCLSDSLKTSDDYALEDLSSADENENIRSVCKETFLKTEELQPSDDDSWLEMDKDKFDSYLQSTFKCEANADEGKIMSGIQKFLNRSSDFAGVESPLRESDMRNLDVDMRGLEALLNKTLTEDLEKEEASDISTEDEEEIKEYMKWMEQELRGKNIIDDSSAMERVLENLTAEQSESYTGPSRTLLSNL